jgi:LuxR family transcriptional regulator, maltose regulon positive regulatory protein
MAQWAHRRSATQPIAWIAVDRLDISPVQRTRALLESINALYPNDDPCDVDRICQTIDNPKASADVAIDGIASLLADRGGPPLVWIWDDIHVIEQTAVWVWLDHFLARLADHVRIVMIGRTRPRLALAGRLARGEMMQINEQDLRFDLDETTQLLELTKGGLNDATVASMYRRTRGWVTGLKLLAASANELSGLVDGPELFDFFAEEVLAGLPAQLRQFLSDVSVLDVINPVSAAQVAKMGSAEAIGLIDSLIQRNLFVTVLDSNRHEIRLHDLLRDCLQARLRSEASDTLADLHIRAAEFESDPVRGSRHWIEAGELRRAIELLAQSPERLIKSGRIRLIETALAKIPPASDLNSEGSALFLRAWLAFHAMEHTQAAQLFEQAAQAFKSQGASDPMASATVMAARVWTYAANLDVARNLLARLSPDELSLATRAEYELEQAWQLTASGEANEAGAHLMLGVELIEQAPSPERLIRWEAACLAHPTAQQVTREEVIKLYYDYSQGVGNGGIAPGRSLSSFALYPSWSERPWPPRDKYGPAASDLRLGLIRNVKIDT